MNEKAFSGFFPSRGHFALSIAFLDSCRAGLVIPAAQFPIEEVEHMILAMRPVSVAFYLPYTKSQ